MDKIEELTRSEITANNLKLIYEALESIISLGKEHKYEKEYICLIETTIEYLLYGDKSDSFIFDTFLEYNFVAEFLKLSKTNNRAINLQIIKSFSLLIINLTNKQTIYYIFSNNFINQIISNNYDRFDSDFLSYYINFLKTLSLKMDRLTIQFFFFKKKNVFPLLDNALKLYNHPDPMIINVVRNIFLTILKLNNLLVIDYICSLPCITYFIFTSCRTRDYITQINDKLITYNFDSIKSIYDEVVNDVLFYQDIFSLKIEKITYILTNCLFQYVILPLLCSSLIPLNKKTIDQYIGLNMLIIFAFYIEDEGFLNTLFAVLFNEQLHQLIMWKIAEDPGDLPNYRFNMEEKGLKKKEQTFEQMITYNFDESFIRSIQFMTKSQYKPLMDIAQKVNKIIDINKSGMAQSSEDIYKGILFELNGYFTPEETAAMSGYHKLISVSTGISCGLTFRNEKASVIQVLNNQFEHLKTSPSSNKLIKNQIRDSILNIFKSTDDSLILLSGILINIFLRKNNIISHELLSLNQMLPSSDFKVNKEAKTNVISDSFTDINSFQNNIIKSAPENTKPHSDIMKSKTLDLGKIKSSMGITFLNYYSFTLYPKKYDIITLASKYFQEQLRITQPSYLKEVIENIVSLFNTETILRSLTLRVLIEIATKLIQEDVPSNDPNLLKINEAYLTSIMDINKGLQQDSVIMSRCYSLLEDEWKKYNSDLLSIIDTLIKEPFMLYPYRYEDTLQNYPCYLKTAKGSTDKYSLCLCLFMGLNDFRVKVAKTGDIIKDVFPLRFSGGSQAEINERIPLSKISGIYSSKVKKGNLGSYVDYSMIIIQNYLIFTSPDIKDPKILIVKQKYPIRYLDIQCDRSQPRNLIIYFHERESYVEIILNLKDVKSAEKVKTLLEDHRRTIEKTEFIMLESYFDDKFRSYHE